MHISYLSLGSNLGDRCSTVTAALALLESQGISIQASSDLYRSAPWGYVSDKHFINQIVRVCSHHSPHELLALLHQTEIALGRNRSMENGYTDRNIDIDILFYDDQIINTTGLKVPHPLIAERRFILEPLASIASEFIHPVLNVKIKELLERCVDKGFVSIVNGSSKVSSVLYQLQITAGDNDQV